MLDETRQLLKLLVTGREYKLSELKMRQDAVVRALRELRAMGDREGTVYIWADLLEENVDTVRLLQEGFELKQRLGLG